MTRTIISSATKTIAIGFDEPFCVIGERINPTGRKKLAAELEDGDFTTVERDALEQVACGAMVLDINSGAVFTNKMAQDPRYADNNFVEPPLMRDLITRIQALVDVPLCIDSSVPGALQAGLEASNGRPLLNSVTGEEERLEVVLPLVKKYDVPVVAISNDDTGISEDPDVRNGDGGQAGLCAGPSLARGAGREHNLRRVKHQLWLAPAPRHQRRVFANGDDRRDDQRDHEPGPRGRDGGDPRRQHAAGS